MAKTVSVIIGAEDRQRLAAVVGDRNRPQKHVQRARIVLLSAARLPVLTVASQVGVSRPSVWRWQQRFAEAGVDGLLRDKTRKPGKTPLLAETVAKVLALPCAEAPGEATHWTGRAVARAAGVSLRAVQRIWQAHRLSVALFAARRVAAALDGLQHLPQVPARRRLGGDLGGAAHGAARPARARREPERRRSRQSVAEVGGKGGGRDDAVGYDAGKKVKGRKIHALVDTLGLPMRVVVHSAGTQDRDGAALVLDKIRARFPWLELVWADGGYNARQVDQAVVKLPHLRIEIVKRSDDMTGFVVLPRRWVVERTFSWFGRNRRLAKNYENLADTLLAFVTLASIQLALRRLTRG